MTDSPLTFNKNAVQIYVAQKHLVLFLNSKLNFNYHVNSKINKYNKIIGIMKWFIHFYSFLSEHI